MRPALQRAGFRPLTLFGRRILLRPAALKTAALLAAALAGLALCGVLLGTGGLVKAYGGGVHQALAALTTERKTPLIEYTLQCEYGQLAGVESLLAQFAGKIISSEYQAVVDLKVALPQAELAAFSTKLADFSRGSLQLRRIDE